MGEKGRKEKRDAQKLFFNRGTTVWKLKLRHRLNMLLLLVTHRVTSTKAPSFPFVLMFQQNQGNCSGTFHFSNIKSVFQ